MHRDQLVVNGVGLAADRLRVLEGGPSRQRQRFMITV
jgi:hypothetical protein